MSQDKRTFRPRPEHFKLWHPVYTGIMLGLLLVRTDDQLDKLRGRKNTAKRQPLLREREKIGKAMAETVCYSMQGACLYGRYFMHHSIGVMVDNARLCTSERVRRRIVFNTFCADSLYSDKYDIAVGFDVDRYIALNDKAGRSQYILNKNPGDEKLVTVLGDTDTLTEAEDEELRTLEKTLREGGAFTHAVLREALIMQHRVCIKTPDNVFHWAPRAPRCIRITNEPEFVPGPQSAE